MNTQKMQIRGGRTAYHPPRRISIVAHYTIGKTAMVCPNAHCSSIFLTFLNQWCENLAFFKA